MLNDKQERELCYIVSVEEIQPIPGYDRVEYARIGAGWWVVVRKEQFRPGDLAVYFEIDSKVPAEEPFLFLESKKFKIKTQKMCKVVSQGLLMSAEDFGWEVGCNLDGKPVCLKSDNKDYVLGDFLTKTLGVTYADSEDEKRKAPSTDKYQKMVARHKKLFKNKFIKWIYSKEWGKKFLFKLFGKKKDKKTDWPIWVVKTDEERCQNMPFLFSDNTTEWIATEKIDGTSTTFTVRGFGKKRVFLTCSRNVVYDTPEKEARNYYKESDGNVYLEMRDKYDVVNIMGNALDVLHAGDNTVEFLTVQGETYGGNIQKRTYTVDGSKEKHDICVFNIIIGYCGGVTKRLNPTEGAEFAEDFLFMPYVPIIDEHFKLPTTCDELLAVASGESKIDGGMREGLVFRSYDGTRSFKAVDNNFLLKYHSN